MPDIGFIHPIVVHFVIALLVAGVVFRIVALTGRVAFASPAARVLLVTGTLAAVVAVASGDDAHGPAERVPGARAVVQEHEAWGERTRNLFLVVVALEVAAVLLGRPRYRRAAVLASAVLGAGGLYAIYETGEHGGDLVYSYAGGVGVRTGRAEDVSRLLVAGLYHQAVQDRAEGRLSGAARLIDEMRRRLPTDPEVQVLLVESYLLDRGDARAALNLATSLEASLADNRRMSYRLGLLRADAWLAAGAPDSARFWLESMREHFPDATGISDRLDRLR